MVRAMNNDLAGPRRSARPCTASPAVPSARCSAWCSATWWGWGDVASIALAVALAFFFGYLLTFSSVRRHGASPREAVRLALASDTVSIATMEVVDNLFILVVPGAMAAGLASGLFWWSLAVSLAVAFVADRAGQPLADLARPRPRRRPRAARARRARAPRDRW